MIKFYEVTNKRTEVCIVQVSEFFDLLFLQLSTNTVLCQSWSKELAVLDCVVCGESKNFFAKSNGLNCTLNYSSIVLGFFNLTLQLRRTDVTAFCMQFKNSEDR